MHTSERGFTNEEILHIVGSYGIGTKQMNELCLIRPGVLMNDQCIITLNKIMIFNTTNNYKECILSMKDIKTFYICFNLTENGDYVCRENDDVMVPEYKRYRRFLSDYANSFTTVLNLKPEEINMQKHVYTFTNVYITPTILKHMRGVRIINGKLTQAWLTAIHTGGPLPEQNVYLEIKDKEIGIFKSKEDMLTRLSKVNLNGIKYCCVNEDIDIIEEDIIELAKRINHLH